MAQEKRMLRIPYWVADKVAYIVNVYAHNGITWAKTADDYMVAIMGKMALAGIPARFMPDASMLAKALVFNTILVEYPRRNTVTDCTGQPLVRMTQKYRPV